jgi:hypothetical protein
MIFLGSTAGGGVLLLDVLGFGLMSASDVGTRQKGVLKIRTDPT